MSYLLEDTPQILVCIKQIRLFNIIYSVICNKKYNTCKNTEYLLLSHEVVRYVWCDAK